MHPSTVAYLQQRRARRERETAERHARAEEWLERLLDALRASAAESPEFMRRMEETTDHDKCDD